MIDLHHVQVRIWVTQGEGIESGSHHDVLIDAGIHRLVQRIFRESTSDSEEGSKKFGVELLGRRAKTISHITFEKTKGKWIVEDKRPVEKLVSGTTLGDAIGCSACAATLHHDSLIGRPTDVLS